VQVFWAVISIYLGLNAFVLNVLMVMALHDRLKVKHKDPGSNEPVTKIVASQHNTEESELQE
jgi:hypothetical protein